MPLASFFATGAAVSTGAAGAAAGAAGVAVVAATAGFAVAVSLFPMMVP